MCLNAIIQIILLENKLQYIIQKYVHVRACVCVSFSFISVQAICLYLYLNVEAIW